MIYYLQYIRKQHAIRQKRAEILASKLERRELQQRKQEVRSETLTLALQDVGGLWTSSEQVDRSLAGLKNEKDRRAALETQLKYRRYVLKTSVSAGLLALSAGGKKLALETLAMNLKKVIGEVVERAASLMPPAPEPVLQVDEARLTVEKSRFRELVAKERGREEERGRKEAPSSKRRRTSIETPTKVPEVTDPEDLIGKRVRQQVGETHPRFGIVTEVRKCCSGKNSGKYMFSVCFDRSKKIVKLPLLDQLESGILTLPPITPDYLVGRRIDQRCKLDDDEEYWYTGTVLSYDKNTRKHTIQYDYQEEDEEEEEDDDEDDSETEGNIYDEPLLKDYLSGDVRILLS